MGVVAPLEFCYKHDKAVDSYDIGIMYEPFLFIDTKNVSVTLHLTSQ